MNWMRLFIGRPGWSVGHDATSSHSKVMSAAWLSIALAGLVMLGASGCAYQRIPAFQRGTSCSAQNVQRYAKEHNLTYEQALDQIRKEDARKWDEEETRQAKSQHNDIKPATEGAPASVGGVQLEGYRQCEF